MNRYLLLILLSSFAHVVPLSSQCDTGFAYPNHALSVPRSLLHNADVALLKTYHAETLDRCITDCCAEKFGLCSVASFKNTTKEGNCQHFNCRPVKKCMFLSSNITDSFTFTSSSLPRVLVPSSNASKGEPPSSSTVSTPSTKGEPGPDKSSRSEQEHGVTKEAVATYSEEQLAFTDDNATIRPRKGVEDVTEISLENVSRSGVKPRKGVNLDGINTSDTKSKVKPRKGVGPYRSFTVSSSSVEPTVHRTSSSSWTNEHSTEPSTANPYKDIADDVVSALKKVFEDDTTKVKDVRPSSTSPVESADVAHTASTTAQSVIPTTVHSATVHSTPAAGSTTSSTLQSSLATNYVASTSVQQTPDLTTPTQAAGVANRTVMPLLSSPTILEHSKLLFHEVAHDGSTKSEEEEEENENSVESESERKYKSSMHLVLSLVFGLLVLFSVFGVVAKRVYDGWMRRHYRRMDFLIDGMYNGYG